MDSAQNCFITILKTNYKTLQCATVPTIASQGQRASSITKMCNFKVEEDNVIKSMFVYFSHYSLDCGSTGLLERVPAIKSTGLIDEPVLATRFDPSPSGGQVKTEPAAVVALTPPLASPSAIKTAIGYNQYTIITNQNPETVQFLQLIELRQDSSNNDVAINFIALPGNSSLENLCIDPTISFETFTNKFNLFSQNSIIAPTADLRNTYYVNGVDINVPFSREGGFSIETIRQFIMNPNFSTKFFGGSFKSNYKQKRR